MTKIKLTNGTVINAESVELNNVISRTPLSTNTNILNL